MKNAFFKIFLLWAVAGLSAGCGGGGTAGTSAATGAQLTATTSDYVDGASHQADTVLIYNPDGDAFEQWTADARSVYYYDENDTLIQEDIEYANSPLLDSVFYAYDNAGNLVSKRYERMDGNGNGQLYLTINYSYGDGHIATETHVAPYTVDGDGHILVQDSILTTISYIYAYKDASQGELILTEKRSQSPDGEIRVYYRYDAARNNVVAVEYDWNNDFSIDAIMYVTYDAAGRREADEIYDYDAFGNETLKLTVLYTWESSGASADTSPFGTSGLVLGLEGGPYY